MADPGFLIIPLFFILFPLLWLGVVKLISLFGWKKFVNDRMMRTEPPPDAQKFSMQTVTLGNAGNYRNSMTGWVHQTGLYMRPMWIFQFGHPLIKINWNDITSIEEQKIIRLKVFTLTFWNNLPKIRLYGRLGEAAKQAWEGNNSHQSHHVDKGN